MAADRGQSPIRDTRRRIPRTNRASTAPAAREHSRRSRAANPGAASPEMDSYTAPMRPPWGQGVKMVGGQCVPGVKPGQPG